MCSSPSSRHSRAPAASTRAGCSTIRASPTRARATRRSTRCRAHLMEATQRTRPSMPPMVIRSITRRCAQKSVPMPAAHASTAARAPSTAAAIKRAKIQSRARRTSRARWGAAAFKRAATTSTARKRAAARLNARATTRAAKRSRVAAAPAPSIARAIRPARVTSTATRARAQSRAASARARKTSTVRVLRATSNAKAASRAPAR